MKQPDEIWKDIKSFSNYQVSNVGRIRSFCRGYLHFIKSYSGNKYLSVVLYKEGKSHREYIHILVLETFVGPRPEAYVCNHKNGNKQNNDLTNLEWVTKKENLRHAYQTGLQYPVSRSFNRAGENTSQAKLKNRDVWLIKKLLYHNIKIPLLSKMFRMSYSTIYQIKRGWTWSHIEFDSKTELCMKGENL